MLNANDSFEDAEPVWQDGVSKERRREDRPTTGEAPFYLDEVFFSRTNERGIIQSGNYVFRRTANYDWDKLLGAPHKIVRNPDMPKGVFWLLWDRIKKGKPMGAYVKNLAEDGLYYWVFAMVVPCKDGYLSARIKPTSPVFKLIKEEYEALRKREEDESLSPDESARVLLQRMEEHGFESYEWFEAHALSEELRSRNKGLNLSPDKRIEQFKAMLEAAENLKTATDELVQEFAAVQIIPHNMRVMASRLEPTGGPFSTLSGNYGSMSADISKWFEANVVGEDSNFSTINSSVNMSMFMEGIVGILKQCDRQLLSERRSLGQIDVDAERKILSAIVAEYDGQSALSLEAIQIEAARIKQACSAMSRHILGLGTTRVLCKIESARIGAAGVGLSEIIGQLGRFQDKIGAQLELVGRLSEDIQAIASGQMMQ